MREYALIPDSQLTIDKALKFPVITNFPTTVIFESTIVVDANGQQSEIITDHALCRWAESGEEGFTTEQVTIIDTAKNSFNQGRDNKPKLGVVRGNSEFARAFNTGRKLTPKPMGNSTIK